MVIDCQRNKSVFIRSTFNSPSLRMKSIFIIVRMAQDAASIPFSTTRLFVSIDSDSNSRLFASYQQFLYTEYLKVSIQYVFVLDMNLCTSLLQRVHP